MKDLANIEAKIAELEKKKSELLHKQSSNLFKKLSTELSGSFSPELVLAIVHESWSQATPEQKKDWLKKAEFFRDSRRRKSQKPNPQNAKTSA